VEREPDGDGARDLDRRPADLAVALREVEVAGGEQCAGHDTQNIARIARTAMVFARSKDGRSHTPEEFTSVEDAVAAIRVLAATLYRLAY